MIAPYTADRQALDRARELVLAYGWNTTSYQILNPGFRLWFSASVPAVVGYVLGAHRRVVAGAPICAAEQLPSVAAEFEDDARRCGTHVVYFGAEARLDTLYRTSPTHSMVRLGAQPVWHPARWTETVAPHASLRAQFSRARNKGIHIEQWPSASAEQHPQLAHCLQEWLATRSLPPLHFLVEPDTLSSLRDRKVFVAIRDNNPVGFLVASPIPARTGWLTEQFVRGHDAPNGTAELLIDTAIRWMADAGAQYVTLGLAPLSSRALTPQHPEAPFWVRTLFRWVRAHGRRFYNFDGLDAFKAKFDPEGWEPVYAISNERKFSMGSLVAIASAFTNGAPVRTVLRGLERAVQQEMTWALRSRREQS